MIRHHSPRAKSQDKYPARSGEPKRIASRGFARRFLAFVRRSKLIVGVFVLLSLSILFAFAVVQRNGVRGPGVAPLSLWDVILAVGANLIGSLILFLIVFGLLQYLKDTHREEVLTRTVVEPLKEVLRDGQGTVYAQADTIDWPALFAGADEVLFLGERWRGSKQLEALPAFLDRGGKIRLLLPDPNEKEMVAAVGRWTGREPREVEGEIRQAVSFLEEMVVRNLGPDRAPAHFAYGYAKQLNCFNGIYFKPGKLLLSFYPHEHGTNGELEPPSFLVRTDLVQKVGDWFEKEWARLSKTKPV